jgi:hypothetical protein
MWFAFWAEDHPDRSRERPQWRDQHLARLNALLDEGRLLMAGPLLRWPTPEPLPDAAGGSLIVADFGSSAEARRWIDADPYREAGLFRSVKTRPFLPTVPPD